jgi:FkbM family methyltransferase
MHPLFLRAYRLLKPVLGHPFRVVAHSLRRRLTGDTSQLGEASVAYSLAEDAWPRWVVEVGANDGITGSNARLFLRKGWNALLVEPNPNLFPRLVKNVAAWPAARCESVACSDAPGVLPLRIFADDPTGMLSTIHSDAETNRGRTRPVAEVHDVEVVTLTSLLDRHEVPRDFGVLSVDAEGHDLNVLRGLDFERYRPHLIITESDERTEEEEAKRALLHQHGYTLIERVGVNTIWQHTA